MSDLPFDATPRYRKVESAMDLLDPAQHFQGGSPSEKEIATDIKVAEDVEERKVAAEKLEAEKAALAKKRDLRKRAAKRTGRRASIVTGPLGTQREPEIRRATLG